MSQPECFFLMSGGALDGFALGRVADDEAELLTLVVAQEARGRGLGRRLLQRFEAAARLRHATEAFLEVASDNTAAMHLYRSTGWRVVGTRPGYYGSSDALAMRKGLTSGDG
jgi:ribosomal-protein-alanine N-acetyltransferase